MGYRVVLESYERRSVWLTNVLLLLLRAGERRNEALLSECCFHLQIQSNPSFIKTKYNSSRWLRRVAMVAVVVVVMAEEVVGWSYVWPRYGVNQVCI